MNASDLQLLLKKITYRVVTVCEQHPKKKVAAVLEHQVLRLSFPATANYKSFCKTISRKALVAKLSILLKEIDESLFWLKTINDLQLHPAKRITAIIQEAAELANVLASSGKISPQKTILKY